MVSILSVVVTCVDLKAGQDQKMECKGTPYTPKTTTRDVLRAKQQRKRRVTGCYPKVEHLKHYRFCLIKFLIGNEILRREQAGSEHRHAGHGCSLAGQQVKD